MTIFLTRISRPRSVCVEMVAQRNLMQPHHFVTGGTAIWSINPLVHSSEPTNFSSPFFASLELLLLLLYCNGAADSCLVERSESKSTTTTRTRTPSQQLESSGVLEKLKFSAEEAATEKGAAAVDQRPSVDGSVKRPFSAVLRYPHLLYS